MSPLDSETAAPEPAAQGVRDGAAHRARRYGLGLVLCLVLPAPLRSQAASTDDRPTTNRSSNMTQVTLTNAPPSVPTPVGTPEDTHIRPFRVKIEEKEIVELRRRIAAMRWPGKELVEDRSQGVQLTTLRELARYWATDYDWRKAEARLNAYPQFVTRIDGVDIHFIHVRSRHENALPLIMTHGWPGSVMELLETIGPLTDPTSHGGTP